MKKLKYYIVMASVLTAILSGYFYSGEVAFASTGKGSAMEVKKTDDGKSVIGEQEFQWPVFKEELFKPKGFNFLTQKEKDDLWDLISQSEMNGFPEFSKPSEVPIDKATFFVYWLENKGIKSLFKKHGIDLDKLYGSKENDPSIDWLELEGGGKFAKVKMSNNLVKELFIRYFGDGDFRGFKDCNKKYDLAKDWFSIDKSGITVPAAPTYPSYRLKIKDIKKNKSEYTVICDLGLDMNDLNTEDEWKEYMKKYGFKSPQDVLDNYKKEKREYKLGRHKDGGFYLKSMKILEEYKK